MNGKHMLRAALLALVTGASLTALPAAAQLVNGKAVYDANCSACHNNGIAGAPKLGDGAAWGPRIKAGVAGLYTVALNGRGAMPAKGGNTALSNAEVQAAVNYIVSQSDPGAKSAATPAAKPAPAAAPAAAPVAAPAPRPAPAAAAAPAPAAAPAVAAPAPTAVALSSAAPNAAANSFNRLMRPPSKQNLPPSEDGIHDPANDGTHALQPPLAAFDALVRNFDGNRVDWVKSLTDGKIAPRFDRVDVNAKPMVMDMNIVREVKGSMPDVVYPHKQHTEWLDCSNCHPAIFIPQKGANQISMASILLGQSCGVCHGKVAFPVSDCRRCHSKAKPMAATASPASPAGAAAAARP